MKNYKNIFLFVVIIAVVTCEPPISKRPPVFHGWPSKSAKQQLPFNRSVGGKQKTLVLQIRSDQPVPLVLTGGRNIQALTQPNSHNLAHAHAFHSHIHPHHLHNLHYVAGHLRGPRPIKLAAPIFLKPTASRKPLKIKLTNSKLKTKPSALYDKPFNYEKPGTGAYEHTFDTLDPHSHFISNHFTPIHTIPAPNLASHDNHVYHEDTYLPPEKSPKPQPYHQYKQNIKNEYQVIEDSTNDLTLHDPLSGSQKLFAPDPDPSLPTSKILPATESFNKPSNGKPLPSDVQNNVIHPAQPLLQIVSEQQQPLQQAVVPEIYPIQFTQQAQLQPFVTANVPTVQAAAVGPIPLYNPTFLVTQSNNLYSQHKQQLFHPVENVIQTGYINADFTQEVASNGQILQAAKDPQHNIHPVLDNTPQFAALIAAPSLGEDHSFAAANPLQLAPQTSSAVTPQSGFVVSNFYSNPQDSSQLLQAYAEEEAQRQHFEEEQQLQQEQVHHNLLLQQQNNLHQLQIQQSTVPAIGAFDEHKLMVQQQLGPNTPLRIFVPDEETIDGQRIQKRADKIIKGIVEDANKKPNTRGHLFEVSSSVELSNENNQNDRRQNNGDKDHSK